jgi:hypothetical protein
MKRLEMNRPYVPIPTPELRKRVRVLAKAGLSDDEIARAYLLHPTELRERFGEELKAGRGERKPPSPPTAVKPNWSEPPRSRTAMAVQTAWLRAQVRAAVPSVTSGASPARQPRAGKKEKTDADNLEDWRKGHDEALHDLSDDALEDIMREGQAQRAALGTCRQVEAGHKALGFPVEARHEHADHNQVPPGVRRDEIFADVVYDGPKKIEIHPNRWSKGEVLDYLFEQALDEPRAEHLAKHLDPS